MPPFEHNMYENDKFTLIWMLSVIKITLPPLFRHKLNLNLYSLHYHGSNPFNILRNPG